jgi:hypothetical protein
MNRIGFFRAFCRAAVFACAACCSHAVASHGFVAGREVAGAPQVSVWAMVVTLDPRSGEPGVTAFRPSLAYETEVAPCASTAEAADAHRARLPRKPRAPAPHDSKRDAVLESLNETGVVICRRIYPVVIDRALEAPPSGPGKMDWVWTTQRETTFFFTARVPQGSATAFRVSGWRGVRARTFAVSELQRRFP